MILKFKLKKTLKKAKKDLKQYGRIDSPVFCIKSKNPELRRMIYHPSYENPRDFISDEVAANIHKLCNDYDAEEVLTIADTFIHSMNDETRPPRDALLVMLERGDKIFRVTQPYKMDRAGKVKFGKKHWETRDKTGLMGNFEGLVQ